MNKKKSDGYIYVYEIQGRNLLQAEANAKRKILIIGLGEMIEGLDGMTSYEKLQKLDLHFEEKYILEYSQIGEEKILESSVQISARGKLNRKLITELLCDDCRGY